MHGKQGHCTLLDVVMGAPSDAKSTLLVALERELESGSELQI